VWSRNRATATGVHRPQQTQQASNRGEKIAVFFVNNTVYGNDRGQSSAHDRVRKTETSPEGRDPLQMDLPLHWRS
jgi:2-oxoisovalerate ferredoxin oxidoreductase beta subunit